MSFKLSPEQIREYYLDDNVDMRKFADKASAHTAWAIVDFLQNNEILKHNGVMRLARHLHAEGIFRPDVPETKFGKTEPLPDDEDEHMCTGCQYDRTCAYQEGEMADGDCGDFRHNINDCLHYEPKIDHIVDANKKIEGRPDFCPECGGVCVYDHNSYQCHSCKKLYPLHGKE